MAFCPNCGTFNDDAATVCTNCGGPLEPKIVPAAGEETNVNDVQAVSETVTATADSVEATPVVETVTDSVEAAPAVEATTDNAEVSPVTDQAPEAAPADQAPEATFTDQIPEPAPAPIPDPVPVAPFPQPDPMAGGAGQAAYPPPGAGYQSNFQSNYQTYPGAIPNPTPAYDIYDHTAEFDPADISENKCFALLTYLLGAIGILLAALVSHDSAYVRFHLRQAVKFTVVNILLGIVAGVLCFTVIVPIAAGVCYVIMFVLKIIAVIQIFGGRAVEPYIIRNLGFLN